MVDPLEASSPGGSALEALPWYANVSAPAMVAQRGMVLVVRSTRRTLAVHPWCPEPVTRYRCHLQGARPGQILEVYARYPKTGLYPGGTT